MATASGSSRIYPAEEMDLAVSSVGYRGGSSSTHLPTVEEMETRKSGMTLEEARWTGVRKKIPGMSGIPTRSKLQARQKGVVDPYHQKMNDMRVFIRQHFHQKECARFVPKAGQKVKKTKDLVCHCGDILLNHAGMQGPFEHFSSADMLEEFIVPKQLQKVISRRNETPPESLPKVSWEAETAIRTTATCTYGKVNFVNVEHLGGKKPAKYIRMSAEDSIEHLMSLMVDHWKIMEPKTPNLVISVVGGAKNFKLDGRMRDTFSTGLIKAAKTTSAWLISSGFNMGVMKSVGNAVRLGQSFCWDNDRMAHVLRCIGIAPWGYVKNRRHLESFDGQGKFDAEFRTSNVILHGQPVPLNADHTHFIFVDDGYRNRYGGVAEVRSRLEQKISQPQAEGGLGIPVVLVVVEGGTDCIADAKSSLAHNIPVVVCAGTGRAADILAYAYSHTKSTSGGLRQMKEKHEFKLMDKIYEAYGKSWKDHEIDAKTMEIKEKVQFCCQNSELMTVFYMNKHEDLDLSILSVLLKAKKGADEEQRLSQLKLALTWDRVDIAQEEIFREDVLWSTGSLGEVLTEALLLDKVKFVELILQQGIVMKEYLTVDRLQNLYFEVPKHNYLYKLLYKMTGKEVMTLENIRELLLRLLDRYDTQKQSVFSKDIDDQPGKDDPKNKQFHRPYKHLLIWAILMNRQSLAKLFWELGDEPVTSALASSRIYHAMARNLPRHESNLKDTLLLRKDDFEQIATRVIDECHVHDPDKAMMLVERKSPCWNGMSCLQIAASATNQVFLSSVACQNSINMIWKHGILASWHKIILGMIFPLYTAFYMEIMNLGETNLTAFQRLGAFYSSPLSKFAHGMLMYLFFLGLHSYMILVDFQPSHVTPIEWVCIIWILAFLTDEIHTFISFPAPTIKSKIRDWYGILKWLDVLNFILVFIGFLLRIWPEYYSATKVIYCFNSIIFYVRIMKIYITNGMLGPKIFMIQRMVEELRMFIMVLLVFLLAYGVASQGLLYHQRNPSWNILKDVLYFPYWQLYGEIFLEELETDAECVATSADCRTYHWLVPFLLAAYLLVGNILLLNLLIAIFSHVFDTVEKNSIQIWKFQMYFLVMEYENKTSLVPPFSLFQHIVMAVQWIGRKTCFKRHKEKQTLGKRHLEYLHLFEKEMMMNFLRNCKAEEMSGMETTVNKLQKRVDELTKLIEDEVIADQQPNMGGTMVVQGEDGQVRKVSVIGETETRWPAVDRVLAIQEKVSNEDFPKEIKTEGDTGQEEMTEKEKKKKHKKKKKHRTEKEVEEERKKPSDMDMLNNINLPPNIPLSDRDKKPEPLPKFLPKPVTNAERGLVPGFGPMDELVQDRSPTRRISFRQPEVSDRNSYSPRSESSTKAWRPQRLRESSDDDNMNRTPRMSYRRTFSNDYKNMNLSSDDSMDDDRSLSLFSKRKKKKKRRSRNMRDTD